MSFKDKIIVVAIICIFSSVMLLSRCVGHRKDLVYKTPDTVYVKVPYKIIEVKREYIEIPKKVVVYKVDTIFRARIEKDTLITGVNIKPFMVEVHKITPDGVPLVDRHDKDLYANLVVDHKGNLEKKKERERKRKNRLKNFIIMTAFVVGAILLHK